MAAMRAFDAELYREGVGIDSMNCIRSPRYGTNHSIKLRTNGVLSWLRRHRAPLNDYMQRAGINNNAAINNNGNISIYGG